MFSSARGWAFAALVPTLLAGSAGCAHRLGASGVLTEPARRLGAEAIALRGISCEEDFVDARQLYRALASGAPERPLLRRQLIGYLLGPLAAIDVDEFRRRGSDLGANDDLDRILASFRDALELFAPEDLLGSRQERRFATTRNSSCAARPSSWRPCLPRAARSPKSRPRFWSCTRSSLPTRRFSNESTISCPGWRREVSSP